MVGWRRRQHHREQFILPRNERSGSWGAGDASPAENCAVMVVRPDRIVKWQQIARRRPRADNGRADECLEALTIRRRRDHVRNCIIGDITNCILPLPG